MIVADSLLSISEAIALVQRVSSAGGMGYYTVDQIVSVAESQISNVGTCLCLIVPISIWFTTFVDKTTAMIVTKDVSRAVVKVTVPRAETLICTRTRNAAVTWVVAVCWEDVVAGAKCWVDFGSWRSRVSCSDR